MQSDVAKRSKPKSAKTIAGDGNPNRLDSMLSKLRAIWEDTEQVEDDVRDALRLRIFEDLERIGKQVRRKVSLAKVIRSRHEADAAHPKLFSEEPAVAPIARFESPEVRVFVTDLAEQAQKFLPDAARFSDIEDYRNHLVEKLMYNSVSTRKRNAGYLINRFFPGQYLHPDLTSFAAAVGEAKLGDVLFYLTARSERILNLVAEKVVWPSLPVGGVNRNKIRDFALDHLKAEDPAKRTTLAIAQCYSKFGIASVSKTKISASIRIGDVASFAYLLHLEFPEPGMQKFEKLLDGPLHKWLLWDRQWMIEQLYLCRQAGLIAKVSEIDSMRQFTTKYSLIEAVPYLANLARKEKP